MLTIDVPLVHMVHDCMLDQHGGRAGLRTGLSKRTVSVIVEGAPDYRKRGTGRRAAVELAAYYLCAIIRERPYRDQNETTAWALAMYALGQHGFAFTPQLSTESFEKLKTLREAPASASEDAVAEWLYRGTQIAGAKAA